MIEKDKIDWHKLTQKPCVEEAPEENRNKRPNNQLTVRC